MFQSVPHPYFPFPACHHLIDLIAKGSKQTDESICLSEVQLLDSNEGDGTFFKLFVVYTRAKSHGLSMKGRFQRRYPRPEKEDENHNDY